MTLFTFEPFKAVAAMIEMATGCTPARFEAARFENGELHIAIHTPVRNQNCVILGSISPPDENLLSLLLLAHTLKKEGARKASAILPYVAYARHDKDKTGESLGTAWLGVMAEAAGIDELIGVDVHSDRAKKLFPFRVISLSPAEVFAEALKRFGLEKAAIVAPDEGAIPRCDAVKKAAGMAPGKTLYFEKHRTAEGITHTGCIGEVGRQVVLVDDILDTGGTLVSACQRLRQAGAEEIHVMVTHGLFTGNRWKELWSLGVKRIFCTDSVPFARGTEDSRITRLSIIPLLEKRLCPLVTT